MKRLSDAEVVKKYSRYVRQSPDQLRYEARVAYLDGRIVWSTELRRRAKVLEKAEAKGVA